MDTMEQFIAIIKQFPILWNTQVKDYRNSHKKDAIWKRIVEELNDPTIPNIQTAKNEWKKLRDGHRESLKRMKASTSGQAAPPENIWKYATVLEFLLPYMRNRKRTGNQPSETQDVSSNHSEDIAEDKNIPSVEDPQRNDTQTQADVTTNPTHSSKRKKNDESLHDLLKEIDDNYMRRCEERDKRRAEEVEQATRNRHPLNMFFDSMCETTKTFPDWLQRDVKKKLLNIVNEAEENYEHFLSTQHQQQGYSSSPSAYSTLQNQTDNFANV